MNRIQHMGLVALTFALTPLAWAGASNPALVEAQRQYREERAVCLSDKSHQDRATCLKEAGASYQEARRGALANPGGTDLGKNATQRCDAQPAADRADCVQRILGAGSSKGSVQGGGVIRQTETKVP